ncbi:hypothetical protein [Zavarzinia sp. CC-PAN008]|uniref:hypothetical protein n=1 Tax=Zavarzinia sp. CC-PAN008 TaxID=3243332 RepID=UPI003F7449B0
MAAPVVYYSPPLSANAGGKAVWRYETMVVGADGRVSVMPGGRDWPHAEGQGRRECAMFMLDQMRVDREAARREGAFVGIIAVLDANSWGDLKRALGAEPLP